MPRCCPCSAGPSEAPAQVHREWTDAPRWQHIVSERPDVSALSAHLRTCAICSDQLFNVRQTIAHLSTGTTLLPGSIIMTGTPKGVGFVRKPPVHLKNGDDVSVWVGGGIGTLSNPVIEEGKSAVVKSKL